MRLILLILLHFFVVSSVFGQSPLSLDLTTNKLSYEYGDTIVVNLTLTNDADSSYSIWGKQYLYRHDGI